MSHVDEDDNRRGVRKQFQWSLQALACRADVQIGLFPNFVAKPDELALDFGHWFEVARSLFAAEFSDDQLASLAAIDDKLETMGYGGAEFEEELWYEEALGARPQWEELRSLAKVALMRFGWATETPPGGRSLYISGGPEST